VVIENKINIAEGLQFLRIFFFQFQEKDKNIQYFQYGYELFSLVLDES
jgi:hypothetical protein